MSSQESEATMFRLGEKSYRSRLLLGTSGYPNPSVMLNSLDASGAELVTISIRRRSLDRGGKGTILDLIDRTKYSLLPNTAGCYTAKEAVLTAELSREALETNLIKVEVIGEEDTLLPDLEELLSACRTLVGSGFTVLPYCSDDLVTCLKLQESGCAAVMPLASPIGSGMGLRNPYALQLLREKIEVPIVVDAGIGAPSDVVQAIELGADAVLINSAISGAHNPVAMARAMKLAVESGWIGKRAGRIPKRRYAKASSPIEGLIGREE